MIAASPPVNDLNTARLMSRLSYTFTDVSLLHQALTHRSHQVQNNERLEFLGDSLLNTIIAEALFFKFSQAKEGQLSRMRAQLVKGETLAELAREFELGPHLLLGDGERKSGGFRRDSILADGLEAIIAAIYLDSDFVTCRATVLAWFSLRLEKLQLASLKKDAKTALQEWLQSRGKPLPVYTVSAVSGKAHEQQFTVRCDVSLLPEPVVMTGANRREAEKAAATAALTQLLDRD